jgi:hypothetical protein
MKLQRAFTSVTQVITALTLVFLAFTVLTQANPGTRLPLRDYGFYAYIGQQILDGKLPYRDAWESKPPAIFYVNAFALWLGRGSRWGIYALQLVFLSAALGLSFRLMRALWGTIPAWVGTLGWLYGLEFTLQGGNLTEEYPLVFHFLAFSILVNLLRNKQNRPWGSILLGFCFGMVFLFRPNNAVPETATILALGLVYLLQRDLTRLARAILGVVAGMAAPILLTGLYFWKFGLLKDLLDAAIFYNLDYSAIQITGSAPLQTGFRAFGPIAWLALAGFVLTAARLKSLWNNGLSLALLLGWPMAIAFSDPAQRAYLHYYINWLPFLAFFSGYVTFTLSTFAEKRWKWFHFPAFLPSTLALLLTIVILLFTGRGAENIRGVSRLLHPGENGSEATSAIARYVSENTQPGEYVLFWGAWPGENLMSKRLTPSAYLFYPLFVRSELSDRYNEQFLLDLRKNTPVIIVDDTDSQAPSLDPLKRKEELAAGAGWPYPPANLEEVFSFVEQNYLLETTIQGQDVYRLRASP